ncbi:MAG: hypothetical protein FD143_2838 [Ignavibacteria bacterium]|nr:MAG: hypothetical protein FD143_2838 [Ignavibacteria bacterium]
MNYGLKQQAELIGVKPKAIYQRRWLEKNRETWNAYKRSIYTKKKQAESYRVFTTEDLQLLRSMR